MESQKTQRICPEGHRYVKTSDCPICPMCESEHKPEKGFLSLLAAPARRALEREGILSIHELASYTEQEIREMHGIGPKTLKILKKLLPQNGMNFKK